MKNKPTRTVGDGLILSLISIKITVFALISLLDLKAADHHPDLYNNDLPLLENWRQFPLIQRFPAIRLLATVSTQPMTSCS